MYSTAKSLDYRGYNFPGLGRVVGRPLGRTSLGADGNDPGRTPWAERRERMAVLESDASSGHSGFWEGGPPTISLRKPREDWNGVWAENMPLGRPYHFFQKFKTNLKFPFLNKGEKQSCRNITQWKLQKLFGIRTSTTVPLSGIKKKRTISGVHQLILWENRHL